MKYYKIKVNNGSVNRCWVVISGGRSIISFEACSAVISEKLLNDPEITKYIGRYSLEFVPVDNLDEIRCFRIYEDII